MGSGVVLLLSVFWLQLDGWLLTFLCLPFISACKQAKGISATVSDHRARSGHERVEEAAPSPDLVLAGPAEGQAVVLFLAFFLRLNDSILLKLNETVLVVPRPEAAKQTRMLSMAERSSLQSSGF